MELRPCPFCGGEAKTLTTESGRHFVTCFSMDCMVKPLTKPTETEEEAIEAWNTRRRPRKKK